MVQYACVKTQYIDKETFGNCKTNHGNACDNLGVIINGTVEVIYITKVTPIYKNPFMTKCTRYNKFDWIQLYVSTFIGGLMNGQ